MLRIFIVFTALLGCGAQPAPHMFGASRHEVAVDGRRFVIWRKGAAVEVIRLGFAAPSEHRALRATMIGLIPEVTGCAVIPHTLMGDSGEMRGRLSCPMSGM